MKLQGGLCLSAGRGSRGIFALTLRDRDLVSARIRMRVAPSLARRRSLRLRMTALALAGAHSRSGSLPAAAQRGRGDRRRHAGRRRHARAARRDLVQARARPGHRGRRHRRRRRARPRSSSSCPTARSSASPATGCSWSLPPKAGDRVPHHALGLAQGRGQGAGRARAHARLRSRASPTASWCLRADAAAAEVFVEAGSARLVDPAGDRPRREARRVLDASRHARVREPAAARPRPSSIALPRNFIDPLPGARGEDKIQAGARRSTTRSRTPRPSPGSPGSDRAVFERRFASRLRDPVFRKAVEPNVARYPSWDRMLHPEKYAPEAATARSEHLVTKEAPMKLIWKFNLVLLGIFLLGFVHRRLSSPTTRCRRTRARRSCRTRG